MLSEIVDRVANAMEFGFLPLYDVNLISLPELSDDLRIILADEELVDELAKETGSEAPILRQQLTAHLSSFTAPCLWRLRASVANPNRCNAPLHSTWFFESYAGVDDDVQTLVDDQELASSFELLTGITVREMEAVANSQWPVPELLAAMDSDEGFDDGYRVYDANNIPHYWRKVVESALRSDSALAHLALLCNVEERTLREELESLLAAETTAR